MKILGNLSNVYKAYKTEKIENKSDKEIKKTKEDSSVKSGSFDKVTISNEAKTQMRDKEVAYLKKRLAMIDEGKENRISDIKEKIKNGTYNISEDKVADAILNNVG